MIDDDRELMATFQAQLRRLAALDRDRARKYLHEVTQGMRVCASALERGEGTQ